MTAPLPSTWLTRDLPVLHECLRRIDDGEVLPSLHEVRDAVGLDETQMHAAVVALESASPTYIDLEGYFLRGVSERARRELGTWPSAESVVDGLAAALSEAADAEEEPQRKGKLRAGAEALAGFARDVAVGVVSAQVGN